MPVPSGFAWLPILFAVLLPISAQSVSRAEGSDPQINTFSIVAFDPVTKDLGVGVLSRYLAVGSVVPWAQAGAGAVATQALARISFGPQALVTLKQGKPAQAQAVLDALIASDSKPNVRQVAIVDAEGRVAIHTGSECLDWAGHKAADH
jgi:uncharacterized Ntn-hydrolase superfamily protein